MFMEKLIAIATTLAILTVSSGQLPKVVYKIQVMQLKLIKQSNANSWGKLYLPPSR
jgi:hypothetical protein